MSNLLDGYYKQEAGIFRRRRIFLFRASSRLAGNAVWSDDEEFETDPAQTPDVWEEFREGQDNLLDLTLWPDLVDHLWRHLIADHRPTDHLHKEVVHAGEEIQLAKFEAA